MKNGIFTAVTSNFEGKYLECMLEVNNLIEVYHFYGWFACLVLIKTHSHTFPMVKKACNLCIKTGPIRFFDMEILAWRTRMAVKLMFYWKIRLSFTWKTHFSLWMASQFEESVCLNFLENSNLTPCFSKPSLRMLSTRSNGKRSFANKFDSDNVTHKKANCYGQ